MAMDNVTLENTQRSISNRDAKSVASVMVNGKWINLSDTLEQANVKSDVGTVSKQVVEQQKIVTSAVAQADSAVAYANEAIKKSRVNSQAIMEINSAVSDAVSDAAVARSDGLRAWNAAQSNVGLIDSNYASASAAISSARTEAIAAADEAKAAASAAQADFDTKFADMAGNINALQVDASGMKQTLVSAKGDISMLQATATGFKNTLTDAQGNISTLQSDVVGLKKTTSDHAGNIATLQATANTLTNQMSSAQGDISTLKQTASGFSSRVSGMETSLANANSKIDSMQIGGINLLKDTDKMTNINYWGLRGGQSIRAMYGNKYANVVGVALSDYNVQFNTPTSFIDYIPQIPFEQGTDYTISFWTTIVDSPTLYLNSEDGYNHQHWGSQQTISLQASGREYSGWKQVTATFKPKVATAYLTFGVSTDVDNKVSQYWASSFKLENGNKATPWSPAPEDTDAKITANTTAIEQNKKAIALKADQTTVDKTNGTIQKLQAQLRVQADQIATKVSSSDLDAKGYATQTYTQTQIKQASDSWNANLTSVNNSLTQSYTNLHATVDGIKSTVATKADQSEVTQLSNLVQTKVSSGDFTSTTTQLKNLINQRVQVGDVISQINQEAGGDTLIQVSNGKKSLILDAGNTIVTGKAWIPVASIADLTADQIQAGTLTGSTVHLGDSNGNTIDLGVLGTNHVGLHSSAQNGDQTYIDYNGIANSGTGYSTTISQGKITTGYMTVNGGGLIDFRSSGNGTTIDSQNIKFYNSNTVNGGIEFSGGNPIATVRNGTVGNELRVRYDRSFALTPIKDESARICASSAAMQVGFVQSGRSTPDRQTTGLWVDGDKRHVNLGVWGADSTWARVEANTHNIHMQADKAHAWLSSDNVFHIYKDGDSSSTATKLQVDGWAWINGWVEAAGHSQHSALSTKTDIQSVDDDKMLEMVNNTDLVTFLYTMDVANGDTHRHIGLIIDDVHDVAQYQTPQDFIAPNGVSRDDDNMIGALFGAVKALTKRIKTLESKVG
ncbi:tail fiber domain-containing protein [uncultured Limosilactobacillus sp.]|uniref:tail fiber domain-containing protein n=1 Tax=uncultured Limosilactobacillus sp. TaxID=2837629 RepID=UPI002597C0AA|nr:tail fiber domain-containing protein [uncultured Limosilactobacillus sp.]